MLSELFHNQTLKSFPRLKTLLTPITANPTDLMINYPIYIEKTNPNNRHSRYTLKSTKYIGPNNYVFLYPMEKCFTSMAYQGARKAQATNIDINLAKIQTQMDLPKDYIDSLKIVTQLYANSVNSQIKGSQPLKEFAKWILEFQQIQKIPVLDEATIKCISSLHLKGLATFSSIQTAQIYEKLSGQFMKGLSLKEFEKLTKVVRAKSKKLKETFLTLAPLTDFLDHSFSPNCELGGIYLTHRRESFMTVKTTKEVLPGDSLTLEFGKFNNYQLFFRYGFCEEDNPYKQYYLLVQYDSVPEVMMDGIDRKLQSLTKIKEKLKNFIRIKPDGSLNSDDLKVLLILFSKEDKNTDLESKKQLETTIYRFLHQQAQKNLIFLKSNQLLKLDNRHLNRLQNDESEIVSSFIKNTESKIL